MGHYCRMCGRIKPNEAYSRSGHRTHICKECHALPTQERVRLAVLDEIAGFLSQSNISTKNLKRLTSLSQWNDSEVGNLASLVLAIGRTHPRRRRRIPRIRAENPELWQKILRSGLVECWDDLAIVAGYSGSEGDEECEEGVDGAEDDFFFL